MIDIAPRQPQNEYEDTLIALQLAADSVHEPYTGAGMRANLDRLESLAVQATTALEASPLRTGESTEFLCRYFYDTRGTSYTAGKEQPKLPKPIYPIRDALRYIVIIEGIIEPVTPVMVYHVEENEILMRLCAPVQPTSIFSRKDMAAPVIYVPIGEIYTETSPDEQLRQEAIY